ncbi:hypothetical protein GJ744_004039 [Endocarpon pusillum]|uniref:Reverse transcriptase Ty1/copia-type domain-containing protein n=1 Tax=Endocarpon pusillum TaxID=364733 RepID=A0A8H7E081_9EURO|nr:hypothetical protein GJ744_004039 [Endocarpon pusillum]
MMLFADNQSAQATTRNPEFHSRLKHIDIAYYYQREIVERGQVKLIHIVSRRRNSPPPPLFATRYCAYSQQQSEKGDALSYFSHRVLVPKGQSGQLQAMLPERECQQETEPPQRRPRGDIAILLLKEIDTYF